MRRRVRQLTFDDLRARAKKARKKPGPKPDPKAAVPHRMRPVHKHSHPIHITLRAIPNLPSFRQQILLRAFQKAVSRTRPDGFRIIEFSVQSNHLHLVVEADDKERLARGMKAFTVRANRLFNAASGRRRGRVWGDRYHRVDLTNARQVRNTLVYCLNNFKKHIPALRNVMKPDDFSSGPWFTGWTNATTTAIARAGQRPTVLPLTFLLKNAWTRHGFIHPGELPRSPT